MRPGGPLGPDTSSARDTQCDRPGGLGEGHVTGTVDRGYIHNSVNKDFCGHCSGVNNDPPQHVQNYNSNPHTTYSIADQLTTPSGSPYHHCRPCSWNNKHQFWRSNSMNLLIVCVIFSLLKGCAAAPLEFTFSDSKQGQLAQQLSQFHISWPSRVNHLGEHITNDLHAKTSANVRSTRSADDVDGSSDAPKSGQGSSQHGVLHYRIPLHSDKDVVVSLKQTNLLLSPAAVIERKVSKFKNISDSTFKILKHHHGCHLSGTVHGEDNSRVAISACDGLRGFLQIGETEYLIEPIKGHNQTNDGGKPHLVYKRSALPEHIDFLARLKRKKPSCGVQDKFDDEIKGREKWERRQRRIERKMGTSSSSNIRKKRSISIEKHVETLVVVDTEMMNYYENEDIETYVLTVMNMVATLFHDASIGNAINIVIVRIILIQDPDENLQITHHADKTLKSFCLWQNQINFKYDDHPNHHDVAILLTRMNICTRMNEPCGTLGLAQVAGLCQPNRTCSINEDTGLSIAWTIAHELGHNFGMRHDHQDCGSSDSGLQFIMAPHLLWDKTPSVWSNCSRASITKFLDRNWGYCLDDPPKDHEFKYPEVPAGTMYDADHQCRLLYGHGAERCNDIEVIENICTTLWCRVNNKCSTKLQAAAVGTLCGKDKWCFSGQCVDIGDRPQAIDGQWSEWGEWSDCTRTCGAGVSTSQRHCNHPPPSNGGKYCTGERKRYRICNTDNCPENGISFRAQQCSEFNDVPFKGAKYEWEPLSTPETPCQLHCKPKNLFFSVILKDIITDGTPCPMGQRQLCISGRCRHFGCDWILESNAKDDICGVCFGDGSSCQTIRQQFNESKPIHNNERYVEATVIPAGARNIRVEEVAEAINYLALRNNAGQYYLNGDSYIQLPGDYELAGTVITYRRMGDKETFFAPGPLKEPLHLMLLMQVQNSGVEFEYTVPKENATGNRKPEFSWDFTAWSHCTISCGGGTQRSTVICKEQEAGVVDDMYCNHLNKPDDMLRECNTHLCPARWWTGPWQHCSVTCGDKGTHGRTVICVRSLGSDEQIALNDQHCLGLDKPMEVEPCHHKDPCPGLGVWVVDEWSNCTRTCNGGVQFRKVNCVDGVACNETTKPDAERPCNGHICPDHQEKTLNIHEGDDNDSSLPGFQLSSSPQHFTSASHPESANDKNVVIGQSSANRIESKMADSKDNIHHSVHKHRHHGTHHKKKEQDITDIESNFINKMNARHRNISYNLISVNNSQTAGNITSRLGEFKESAVLNYNWQATDWTTCSSPCGKGVRKRELFCIQAETHAKVQLIFCDHDTKPSTEEECILSSCLSWQTENWERCSKTCGVGSRERVVRCLNQTSQQISEGCDSATMPAKSESCNVEDCPADDNAALSISQVCEDNEMNYKVCRMLKKVGLCQKQYVLTHCCRTCQDHHRKTPEHPRMSRR